LKPSKLSGAENSGCGVVRENAWASLINGMRTVQILELRMQIYWYENQRVVILRNVGVVFIMNYV
jgi:hypothetical protein